MQTKLYMRSIALLIALASTSAFAQDYASPYGEWRGQTQYQAFIGTTSDPAAHIVTGLTVVIDAQGKVVGISTENGCRLLGIAAPGITPTILNLDVTLTGCKYAGLNRTYKGYLSVYTKERYAAVSLQSISVAAGKAGTFNIKATLRR